MPADRTAREAPIPKTAMTNRELLRPVVVAGVSRGSPGTQPPMTDEAPYSPFGDTAALIRQVGVWELGAYDGCNCSHFEVQAIEVELSCHKSAAEIRVSSTTAPDYGANQAMLKAVAAEIMRQLIDRCDGDEEWVRKTYTVKV